MFGIQENGCFGAFNPWSADSIDSRPVMRDSITAEGCGRTQPGSREYEKEPRIKDIPLKLALSSN